MGKSDRNLLKTLWTVFKFVLALGVLGFTVFLNWPGLAKIWAEHVRTGKIYWGNLALAAVIFGKYTAIGAAIACLIFGLGNGLSFALQDLNLGSLLNTLPYVFTLIALVGLVGRTTPPAADGIPYDPGSE